MSSNSLICSPVEHRLVRSIPKFNLQLFSEEKTEQPTAKKIRDSRNKGQVAQSKDLNGAVSLLLVFVIFSFLKDFYVSEILGFYYNNMELIVSPSIIFENGNITRYFNESLLIILKLSLPLLLTAMISDVFLSYVQVGFIFTSETLKPKLDKINPLKGFKNMFSSRALVELIKSLAKAGLILYVTLLYVNEQLQTLLITPELDMGQIIIIMWDTVYGVVIRSAILLFVIAIFDFAFKRWKNNKDMMMTKQEIKEEYKQSEGDPQLKSKIKEKQRALAMSRMMQEVPKADVIITNPTHFAVAVKYDVTVGDAPKIIAKGQDLVALNIRKLADEHSVPIVENKPLAQLLYKTVDIGAFITPDLYEAVAEVLAYVYTLKNKN